MIPLLESIQAWALAVASIPSEDWKTMGEMTLEALGTLVFLWACWAFIRSEYHRRTAKPQGEAKTWNL